MKPGGYHVYEELWPDRLLPGRGAPTVSEPTPGRRVIYRGRKIDLALPAVRPRRRLVGRARGRHAPGRRRAGADGRRATTSAWSRTTGTPSARPCWRSPPGRSTPASRPTQTAARELGEETGYRAGRIDRVAEWFVSPGVMNERMYLYLCDDLSPARPTTSPTSSLKPVVVAWDEAVRMVHDGRIEDAKSMLALLLCDRLAGDRDRPGAVRRPDRRQLDRPSKGKRLGHRGRRRAGGGRGRAAGRR